MDSQGRAQRHGLVRRGEGDDPGQGQQDAEVTSLAQDETGPGEPMLRQQGGDGEQERGEGEEAEEEARRNHGEVRRDGQERGHEDEREREHGETGEDQRAPVCKG